MKLAEGRNKSNQRKYPAHAGCKESRFYGLPFAALKVKIFVQWPFGDQLFGFSRQGKFLGAKLY